jgi:dTDP-4-amino-4,6-dideoxygalactose transaminase
MTDDYRVPLMRPTLVNFSEVEESLREVWRSGRITLGAQVEKLERIFAEACGVRHAVAVSSCTSGLMLAVRALDLSGRAVLPAFTWASTGHALVWNGVTPVFCDCEPGYLTLDPHRVDALVTEDVSAIVAANVFGLPPALDALGKVAQRRGIPLIVDSAQGFGSSYRGVPAGGFGDVEVFSLSPTKGLTAGEGGMVTTNHDGLAAKVRSLRDYGKGEDGDITGIGLSARMSEFHAAIAVKNARDARRNQETRARWAALYRERLADVPALRFQEIPADRISGHNYCVVFVDEGHAVGRDILVELLATRGVQTKRYFHPPLHLQAAYAAFRSRYEGQLPVTEKAGREGLALPLYPQMTEPDVHYVCDAIREMI